MYWKEYMKTNLINLKENDFTYEVISTLPLSQLYYESEKGVVDTRTKTEISSIYLEEVSKIVNEMVEALEAGQSIRSAFQKAIYDESRFEILEDYAQGFLNQQQLSDYLRDSYKDEDLAKGKQINDVYIR